MFYLVMKISRINIIISLPFFIFQVDKSKVLVKFKIYILTDLILS